MEEKLILQPLHNSSLDILRRFAGGEPLTADQMNFLDWHAEQLSGPEMDPVLKYYIQSLKKKRNRKFRHSFLLPHEELMREDNENLKKRLKAFLKEKDKEEHVVIPITEAQLAQFHDYNEDSLIFYHGNQFLTGAPFAYGGAIPTIIYFQWGNHLGVVIYPVATERALKNRLLLYFEDMRERDLKQSVEDFHKRLQQSASLQKELILPKKEVLTFHGYRQEPGHPHLRKPLAPPHP